MEELDIVERLVTDFKGLSVKQKNEVINFVEFLKNKKNQEQIKNKNETTNENDISKDVQKKREIEAIKIVTQCKASAKRWKGKFDSVKDINKNREERLDQICGN